MLTFNNPLQGQHRGDQPSGGKIIYVYDALCGWCYGFSPVIQKLHENYGSKLDFEVVSGGMITGDRIGPVSDMADYISRAYPDVEKRSGVKFGKEFTEKTLYRNNVIFTSLTPALAMSAFKNLKPHMAVQFAFAIQHAIYFNGLEPGNPETYGQLANEFGIDSKVFLSLMNEPATRIQAEADFRRSRELGVTGYPTTIFEETTGKRIVISRGYVSFDYLEQRLEQALNAK